METPDRTTPIAAPLRAAFGSSSSGLVMSTVELVLPASTFEGAARFVVRLSGCTAANPPEEVDTYFLDRSSR